MLDFQLHIFGVKRYIVQNDLLRFLLEHFFVSSYQLKFHISTLLSIESRILIKDVVHCCLFHFPIFCLQYKRSYNYKIKMIKIFVLSVILIVCLSKPNAAKYIHQQGRPLNIAHRGLCSILPQNTLQAFEAALYQGADFIELDVVYTKEKQLLVMHDPYLTRITNIKNKSEFSTRYETRYYDHHNKTDWWTDKFTVQQLKTLGIKQDQAPGRVTIFDYKFTFPLLSEVIQMVIAFNKQHQGKRNPDGRLAGILIEAKDSQMYRDLYNIEIGKDILELLRTYKIQTISKAQVVAPIYLHSFDFGTVKYWGQNSELPNNYLIQGSSTFNIDQVNLYATGVGFQNHFLWNYQTNAPTALLSQMRQKGMLVHIWTFKDDVLMFNAKNNIQMYEIGHKTLKLDGIITQFPDVYVSLSQLWKNDRINAVRQDEQKTI